MLFRRKGNVAIYSGEYGQLRDLCNSLRMVHIPALVDTRTAGISGEFPVLVVDSNYEVEARKVASEYIANIKKFRVIDIKVSEIGGQKSESENEVSELG